MPVAEYDVLIVTNGTVDQVEQGLVQLNQRTSNEIPLNANIVYLDSFKDLVDHLEMNHERENFPTYTFNGKTVFMFFNGLEYIQNFLSEVIDYYSTAVHGRYRTFRKLRHERLTNSYFYFDSSVASDFRMTDLLKSPFQFNYIVTVANDILKKLSFMLHRIRGVYLDDFLLDGERKYALRGLLRNFPNLERVELSSQEQVSMRELVA